MMLIIIILFKKGETSHRSPARRRSILHLDPRKRHKSEESGLLFPSISISSRWPQDGRAQDRILIDMNDPDMSTCQFRQA